MHSMSKAYRSTLRPLWSSLGPLLLSHCACALLGRDKHTQNRGLTRVRRSTLRSLQRSLRPPLLCLSSRAQQSLGVPQHIVLLGDLAEAVCVEVALAPHSQHCIKLCTILQACVKQDLPLQAWLSESSRSMSRYLMTRLMPPSLLLPPSRSAASSAHRPAQQNFQYKSMPWDMD